MRGKGWRGGGDERRRGGGDERRREILEDGKRGGEKERKRERRGESMRFNCCKPGAGGSYARQYFFHWLSASASTSRQHHVPPSLAHLDPQSIGGWRLEALRRKQSLHIMTPSPQFWNFITQPS